jgi:flagellar basal-body rod protein FlgG
MLRSLHTAGTGMIAQQANLDVIANNLANINTTGFKEQRAEFQDLMYQNMRSSGAPTGGETSNPEPTQIGLGARIVSTATHFSQGSFITTGNPTNLAVSGEGFFPVTKDGRTLYTRDGSFKLDANGLMVTNDGYPLEPQITVAPGTTALAISPTGVVTGILPGANDPSEIGRIQLAMFTNPAGLTRVGQNLYQAGGASGDAVTGPPGQNGSGSVQQFVLEGSNVQIVEEMVRMITAQRAYEINSKAIQTADDMLATLNQLKR